MSTLHRCTKPGEPYAPIVVNFPRSYWEPGETLPVTFCPKVAQEIEGLYHQLQAAADVLGAILDCRLPQEQLAPEIMRHDLSRVADVADYIAPGNRGSDLSFSLSEDGAEALAGALTCIHRWQLSKTGPLQLDTWPVQPEMYLPGEVHSADDGSCCPEAYERYQAAMARDEAEEAQQ